MEYLIVFLLALGLLAVLAVIADGWRRRPDPAVWLDDVTRHRLLVQTVDGQTLEGTLVRVDADGIALATPRVDATSLSGDVWVPREKVAWVQHPEERPVTS